LPPALRMIAHACRRVTLSISPTADGSKNSLITIPPSKTAPPPPQAGAGCKASRWLRAGSFGSLDFRPSNQLRFLTARLCYPLNSSHVTLDHLRNTLVLAARIVDVSPPQKLLQCFT